jgi:hypothetical protein
MEKSVIHKFLLGGEFFTKALRAVNRALAARYQAWRTAALGVTFLDTDTGRRSRRPLLRA